MIEISYSVTAKKDLEKFGDYIAEQLRNPQTALNTVNKIQATISKLTKFPLIGTPLSSIYEVDTDYRFLVCGKYLAFYRSQESEVFIDRILYGRQSYLAILFGYLPQDETG